MATTPSGDRLAAAERRARAAAPRRRVAPPLARSPPSRALRRASGRLPPPSDLPRFSRLRDGTHHLVRLAHAQVAASARARAARRARRRAAAAGVPPATRGRLPIRRTSRRAVDDHPTSEATHGPVSGWDVSQVDDRRAFAGGTSGARAQGASYDDDARSTATARDIWRPHAADIGGWDVHGQAAIDGTDDRRYRGVGTAGTLQEVQRRQRLQPGSTPRLTAAQAASRHATCSATPTSGKRPSPRPRLPRRRLMSTDGERVRWRAPGMSKQDFRSP